MKPGQLIECNLRNIFLEKSKCHVEAISRSTSKKSRLSISLSIYLSIYQYSEVLYILLLLFVTLKTFEIDLN